MLIEEIQDYLQKGILSGQYKSSIAINNKYYPTAIGCSVNPLIHYLYDYSTSINNLLQTPDKINVIEVTSIFWIERNYTKYSLNSLTLEQAKSIIKTNEMLITKLNDILIQNTLIEQINNVPIEHLPLD